jgi:hypothetical protein
MKITCVAAVMMALSSPVFAARPSFGAAAKFETQVPRAFSVSVVTLLAQPKELEGKLVRVEGFLSADWEGPTLFFSSELCQTFSSFDGLGINTNGGMKVDWTALRSPDCRRVVVEGVYKAYRYEAPDQRTVSLAVVRNVLEQVTYLADISH